MKERSRIKTHQYLWSREFLESPCGTVGGVRARNGGRFETTTWRQVLAPERLHMYDAAFLDSVFGNMDAEVGKADCQQSSQTLALLHPRPAALAPPHPPP